MLSNDCECFIFESPGNCGFSILNKNTTQTNYDKVQFLLQTKGCCSKTHFNVHFGIDSNEHFEIKEEQPMYGLGVPKKVICLMYEATILNQMANQSINKKG